MVVTVFRSEEEFQALAMRLAARLLLPGTGWIAFMQLMDQVGLMMDLLGKRYLPRGSLALLDFHIELVYKELNHLAAILHVYAGGLNFMK